MKRKMVMLVMLAAAALLSAGICGASENKGQTGAHPPLTTQEQLVACSECHQTATPSVYDEWFQSLHGIAMVKCYQCHGTFENLAVVPNTGSCGACHSGAMEKCPPGKLCWECHKAHLFTSK